MKTKYVKVPVSERLPEKSGFYYIKHNNYPDLEQYDFFDDLHDGEYFETEVEWWLEEKEDHSEEMFSVLSGLINDISNLLNENDIEWQECGYFEEAKKLINKIKNG
ncbi:hypothetical protein HZP35_18745 [Elizabethkingia anophelis]|nr:hypothetical protein [Elizabethkingia anophelis]MCT4171301.1 hypothetical protein [Elizabethkingia anophelis]MCT4245716.1 hypothetical protein [Elizabethkingia anophelis]MCT4249406.1 hypothetical protein [Elizabethkingia anophelis]MCT4260440.1 hypothetical protein [Elizabethkingia anophelis]